MKKMKTVVNVNDRIIIDIINHECIQYVLVEARTGKETLLGAPIDFSLSVKKYFGINGKTIRELHDFKSWHNRKLETEMKCIWRAVENLSRIKARNVKEEVWTHEFYDDERAA